MENPEDVVEGKIEEFELCSEPFAFGTVVEIPENW
jgi:hypothetical protein